MGKLGTAISSLKYTNCTIVFGVDIAQVATNKDFPIYSTLTECTATADVVIDCSSAAGLQNLLKFGIDKNIPLVICTTALTAEDNSAIKAAAQQIAILQSANMSLGINLLLNIVNKSAKLLYNSQFDIEIIEKHHNQKKDSPSGTALSLANAINSSLKNNLDYVTDRTKKQASRSKAEIGIHSIRGGTIAGEHSVIFAGNNETIEFKHQAITREVFATGALKAAQFITKQPAGLYSMQNVIEDTFVF